MDPQGKTRGGRAEAEERGHTRRAVHAAGVRVRVRVRVRVTNPSRLGPTLAALAARHPVSVLGVG